MAAWRTCSIVVAAFLVTACSNNGAIAPGPGNDGGGSGADAATGPCVETNPPTLDPDAGCGPTGYRYEDLLCSLVPPDAAPIPCTRVGDGQCYERCSTNADCTETGREECKAVRLFAGGDGCGNRVICLCRAPDAKDCLF